MDFDKENNSLSGNFKISNDSSFDYRFGEYQTHGISNSKWFIKGNSKVLNSINAGSILYLVTFDYRIITIIDSPGNSLYGMSIYFAHPNSSREGGTNENTNGFTCRLYSKKY